MLARLLLLATLAAASTASADDRPLFAPLVRPEPKIIRLLAPPATLDLDALQQFEAASGYQIAYDAYAGALDLAENAGEVMVGVARRDGFGHSCSLLSYAM